jgi:ATP-dependent DNA helicase PIF1
MGGMKIPVKHLYLRRWTSTSHLSYTSHQSIARYKNCLHICGPRKRARAAGVFNSRDEYKTQVEGFPNNVQRGYSTLTEYDGRFSQNHEPVKLTAEQNAVVRMALQGHNIFLTGAAGSGKTVTLLQIIASLERKYPNVSRKNPSVQVIAPTGIAALPLNGRTTYSFAGWKPYSFKQPLRKLLDETKKSTIKAIWHLNVLIIEEISMVENQFLERLNKLLQHVLESEEPFGGLQVIFLGDFYQLPPVKPFANCLNCGAEMAGTRTRSCSNSRCKSSPKFKDGDKWAFKAKVWKELDLKHVKLEQIHRQKDEGFKALLNKVRDGIPLSAIEWSDLIRPKVLPPPAFAIRLMSKRADVDTFNQAQLNSIEQPKTVWNAHDGACRLKHGRIDELPTDKIQAKCDEYLQWISEYHRFPEDLTLKVGAKVVLLYNLDLKAGLVNGSQGTIIDFVNAEYMPNEVSGDYWQWRNSQVHAFTSKHTFRPVVLFTDGQEAVIPPVASETLMGPPNDRYLVCRTQIPLMLAWALSIHKSQGMTMKYVEVSRKDIFESGQLYVALSRATTLDGLTVTGSYTRNDIDMDKEVVDFYKNTKWEKLQ